MSADLVEAALAAATLPCIALATDRSETNLRWALNSLTTNGQMHSVELTVVATAPVEGGTAVGSLTRQLTDAGEVPAVVAAAEAIARGGPPAEDAQPLVSGDPDADWDRSPAATSVQVFSSVAPALGTVFAAARQQGRQLFGFAEHVVTTTYLGTSTGLRRRHVQPTGRLELNAKSADGGSAWAGVGTADFTDVDVERLVADLVVRLGWSATRIDLPAGHYETLLPPTAVADLMIYLYWTAGARDAEEGRSVFSGSGGGTRVGEHLSEVPLTLSSDPDYPGVECAPFVVTGASDGATTSVFDNGLDLAPTEWIRNGRLSELARSRAWAARTGQQPRPLIDNLVLSHSGEGEAAATATLDEMIAATSRGLLLTCLWYIREVDPEQLLLTGLTRDGVYLIEDGQVRGAVNNFRFNESPVDLLRRVTEVGAAEQTLPREWNDYFTRTVMPPLRVAGFNMSTVSQAS